jgi:hypothetical protein
MQTRLQDTLSPSSLSLQEKLIKRKKSLRQDQKLLIRYIYACPNIQITPQLPIATAHVVANGDGGLAIKENIKLAKKVLNASLLPFAWLRCNWVIPIHVLDVLDMLWVLGTRYIACYASLSTHNIT